MLLEVLRSKIWIYLTAHLEMLKNRHRGINGAAGGCDPESLRCSEAAEKTGELRNERRILPLGLVWIRLRRVMLVETVHVPVSGLEDLR